jgi:hypothetical protein
LISFQEHHECGRIGQNVDLEGVAFSDDIFKESPCATMLSHKKDH